MFSKKRLKLRNHPAEFWISKCGQACGKNCSYYMKQKVRIFFAADLLTFTRALARAKFSIKVWKF